MDRRVHAIGNDLDVGYIKMAKFKYSDFEKFIKRVRAMSDFQQRISECARDVRSDWQVDAEIFLPSLQDEVIELLSIITHDDDDRIPYFVYELNFGRDREGVVEDTRGNEVRLKTIRDLWNLLVENQSNKETKSIDN